MKHKKLWFSAVVLALSMFSAVSSFAQDKKILTLQEAIQLSIQNSKQLKISQAKIEEATAAIKEAEDRRLPEASASASYLRLNRPNVKMQTKTDPNGGGTGSTGLASAHPSQAAYAMVNASLPLYSGLRIKYGIASAKYLEEATKLDADKDREEVIMNTVNAYNNLYQSRAALELVKESLEDARQRVKELTRQEQNGLIARNDLLKAQLQASNTELSLLDMEKNWNLATLQMNLLLGLPETTELLPDSSSLQIRTNLKGINEYVQLALQNRRDLAAISYRKKAAGVGIKIAEGEKLPSLALTSGYVAMDIPKVLTVTNAVNLGIGLQYNIASLWKNKAKVQSAKAQEKQLEISQDLLSDAVQLEVNQAYQNYLVSRKKIDVQAAAVEQANENYKVVKNKFNNGLATVADLLDADVAQQQARLNQSTAQSDASVAYNRLLQAAGLLSNSITNTK